MKNSEIIGSSSSGAARVTRIASPAYPGPSFWLYNSTSPPFARSTYATKPPASAAACPKLWFASIPRPRTNGAGSMFSPPRPLLTGPARARRGRCVVATSTRRLYRKPSNPPSAAQASPLPAAVTHSVTPSPPISSRMAPTSAHCRNSSVTPTCAPRKSTPMSPATVPESAPPSTWWPDDQSD